MRIEFLVFAAPFAGCVTLMHGYNNNNNNTKIYNAHIVKQ